MLQILDWNTQQRGFRFCTPKHTLNYIHQGRVVKTLKRFIWHALSLLFMAVQEVANDQNAWSVFVKCSSLKLLIIHSVVIFMTHVCTLTHKHNELNFSLMVSWSRENFVNDSKYWLAVAFVNLCEYTSIFLFGNILVFNYFWLKFFLQIFWYSNLLINVCTFCELIKIFRKNKYFFKIPFSNLLILKWIQS